MVKFEIDGNDFMCPSCNTWLSIIDEFAYPDVPCGASNCPKCGQHLYAQYDYDTEVYIVEVE